jgi:hypothetical protein
VAVMALCVLWFVVRSTRHSTTTDSVDEFEPFVLGEVGVVLDVEGGER